MRDKITEFMKGKSEVELEKIYTLCADKSQALVRATLNQMVKMGKIRRVKWGVYSEVKGGN